MFFHSMNENILSEEINIRNKFKFEAILTV